MTLLLANRLTTDIERMRSRALDFRSQIMRHQTRLERVSNQRHREIEQQRIEEYTVAAGALEEAVALLSSAVETLTEPRGGTQMTL